MIDKLREGADLCIRIRKVPAGFRTSISVDIGRTSTPLAKSTIDRSAEALLARMEIFFGDELAKLGLSKIDGVKR